MDGVGVDHVVDVLDAPLHVDFGPIDPFLAIIRNLEFYAKIFR